MKIFKSNYLIVLLQLTIFFSTILIIVQVLISEQIISLLLSKFYVRLAKTVGLNDEATQYYLWDFYPHVYFDGFSVYTYLFKYKMYWNDWIWITIVIMVFNFIFLFLSFSLSKKLGVYKRNEYKYIYLKKLYIDNKLTGKLSKDNYKNKLIDTLGQVEDYWKKIPLILGQVAFIFVGLSIVLCLKNFMLYFIVMSCFLIVLVLCLIIWVLKNKYVFKHKSIVKNLDKDYVNLCVNIDEIKISSSIQREKDLLITNNKNKNKKISIIEIFNNLINSLLTFLCPLAMSALIIGIGFVFSSDSSKIAIYLPVFFISIGMMCMPLMQLIRNIRNLKLYKLNNDDFSLFLNKLSFNELINSISLMNFSIIIDEKCVLKDINYSFEKNKINYITGKNGIGKSVLLNCIARLELSYEGLINFNSTDSKTIENNLSISYIGQNLNLFDKSIFDNLTYGVSILNNDMLTNLLKRFNLYNKLMQLDDKLDTIIDNESIWLSKGELQKILFIRVILQDREVVLLDEFDSAFDKESKEVAYDILNDLSKNKIIIVISHNKIKNTNCLKLS
ncbi:hypothetical protein SCORR_v1c06220 [Spiroplasma corruscae]|uniref:ABC transporter domain-containing protein n=1 Tax=Spiroplasma corruscae TaxID=216934 RepID=A0A222EQ37_9MOLU|nr:ABC transporter ATP-binding protein [Spiroplasma corruscae]ASP28394.1 hypothetical protein SCORR_v1c06220 [Spiroplasma corruscae]